MLSSLWLLFILITYEPWRRCFYWFQPNVLKLNPFKETKKTQPSWGKRVICYQPKNTIALVPKSEKKYGVWFGRGSIGWLTVRVSVCKYVAVSVNRLNSKFGFYSSISRISNQTVNYYAGQLRSIKIESGIFHILKLTHFLVRWYFPFETNFLNCCLQLNQMELNRMCSVWFSFNAFLNVTHSPVCCFESEILAPKLSPNVSMKWARTNERCIKKSSTKPKSNKYHAQIHI